MRRSLHRKYQHQICTIPPKIANWTVLYNFTTLIPTMGWSIWKLNLKVIVHNQWRDHFQLSTQTNSQQIDLSRIPQQNTLYFLWLPVGWTGGLKTSTWNTFCVMMIFLTHWNEHLDRTTCTNFHKLASEIFGTIYHNFETQLKFAPEILTFIWNTPAMKIICFTLVGVIFWKSQCKTTPKNSLTVPKASK